MQLQGIITLQQDQKIYLNSLSLQKYINGITKKSLKLSSKCSKLNLRYYYSKIVIQSFKDGNDAPNLQDSHPIQNILNVIQSSNFSNMVKVQLKSDQKKKDNTNADSKNALLLTFVLTSDAQLFVQTFNSNSLPILENHSSSVQIVKKRSSSRSNYAKQPSRHDRNRKQTAYYQEFGKGFSYVKLQILKENPQLHDVYQRIKRKFEQKGLISGKQLPNIDWIIFKDDPKMKQFLKLSQVQAYQIQKKLQQLSLQQKISSMQNKELCQQNLFDHQDPSQLMQGYSYIKQMEGYKPIDQQKKGFSILDGENRQKENFLLSLISGQQKKNPQDDQFLEEKIKNPIYAHYQYDKTKQQIGQKMKIPQKCVKLRQMKIQVMNVKGSNTDQLGYGNPHNKKIMLNTQNESLLRKTIQLQRIMYKFMRHKDFDRVQAIKDVHTQLNQNYTMEHPYFQVIKEKANQNYVAYRKRKFFFQK